MNVLNEYGKNPYAMNIIYVRLVINQNRYVFSKD